MGRWALALVLVTCLIGVPAGSARAASAVGARATQLVRRSAVSSIERATGGSAAFSDPAGDAGSAPDVTSVTLANDDQGLLTFRVTVPNRISLSADDVIVIPIATDDPGLLTGSRPGDSANFVIGLDSTGPFLAEWDGSHMVDVMPTPTSFAGSFAGGVVTLSVRQDDLAPGFPDATVPISFNFYVLGALLSGDNVAAEDDAPDGTGFWSYRFSEAPRLIVTAFDPDKTVKAGKSLSLIMGVARGDTGQPVGSGTVVCRARAGTTKLKGKGGFFSVNIFVGGRTIPVTAASCDFKIARKLKGKTIRGSMTVNDGTLSVTLPFSTRVR